MLIFRKGHSFVLKVSAISISDRRRVAETILKYQNLVCFSSFNLENLLERAVCARLWHTYRCPADCQANAWRGVKESERGPTSHSDHSRLHREASPNKEINTFAACCSWPEHRVALSQPRGYSLRAPL